MKRFIVFCFFTTLATILQAYNWTDISGRTYNGSIVEQYGDIVTVKRSERDKGFVFSYEKLSEEDQVHLKRVQRSEEKIKPLYGSTWVGVWSDGNPSLIKLKPYANQLGVFYFATEYINESGQLKKYTRECALENDGELLRTTCHYIKIEEDIMYVVMNCGSAAILKRLEEAPEDVMGFLSNEVIRPPTLPDPEKMALEHFGGNKIFHSCRFKNEKRKIVRDLDDGNIEEAHKLLSFITQHASNADTEIADFFTSAALIETQLGNYKRARELWIESLIKHKDKFYSNAIVFNEVIRAKRSLFNSYWFEGRIAKAFSVYNETAPLEEMMSKQLDKDERAKRQLLKRNEYVLWLSAEDFIAWAKGDDERYRAIQEERISEIAEAMKVYKLDWRNKNFYIAAINKLASSLNNVGNFERSLEVLSQSDAIPFGISKAMNMKKHYGDAVGLYIGLRAKKNTLHDFETHFESIKSKIEAYEDIAVRKDFEVLNAEVYLLSNFPERALEFIDRAVALTEEINHMQYLTRILEIRAKIYLALDNPELAIDDTTRALKILRERGTKISECTIYQVYAKALAAMGESTDAVEVWLIALNLADKFNKPHLAIDILVDLLEFHIANDNELAVANVYKDLQTRLDHGPEVQPFWLNRLSKLKPQLPLSALNSSEPQDRNDEESKIAIDSPVHENLKNSENSLSQPVFTLQPEKLTTRITSGESAVAEFTLLNLGTYEQEGYLQFHGEGANVIVNEKAAHGCNLEIIKDSAMKNDGNEELSVQLSPGHPYAVQININDTEWIETENFNFELEWNTRNSSGNTSTWDIEFSESSQSVTIVDAGTIRTNQFYYIPFFNSVYLRESSEQTIDIYGQASKECRVEIYDRATDSLLAIDSNGDGDYEDTGDFVQNDSNNNLIPDLPKASTNEVIELEVWIFPFENASSESERYIDYKIGLSENDLTVTNRLKL